MAPVKFSPAAAAIAAAAAAGGGGGGDSHPAVSITNRYAFLSTSHLGLCWRLLVGGQPVPAEQLSMLAAAGEKGGKAAAEATGSSSGGWQQLDLPGGDIPPRGSATVLLPYSCQALLAAANAMAAMPAAAAGGKGDGELLLSSEDVVVEFRAALSSSSSWAPVGHTLTYSSVPLSCWMAPKKQQQRQQWQQCEPLSVTTSPAGDVVVRGPQGLLLTVAKGTGCIAAVEQQQQLLLQQMLPCFMRATTDNDRGGSGGSSYAARWAAAGLDRLEVAGEVSGSSVCWEGRGQ